MSEADPDKDSAGEGAIKGICPNCHGVLLGNYCSTCGQPADIHRRSVGGLLHDFFQDIVSFDSRILRTAYALLFRPGELACAFREGRTQRYVPAVRLYLFVSLFFFVALTYGNIAIAQFALYTPGGGKDIPVVASIGNGKSHKAEESFTIASRAAFFAPLGTVKGDMTPAARATFIARMDREAAEAQRQGEWAGAAVAIASSKLASDPAALNGAISEWLPRALFLQLPLFALLLAAFYWRQWKHFYFVDHLVFSLVLHSFAFIVLLAAAWLTRETNGGEMIVGFLIVMFVYLLLAIRRFYRQNWFWSVVKAVGVVSLYTVLIFPLIFIGVLSMGVLYG